MEVLKVLGIDPGFRNCGFFEIRFVIKTLEIMPGVNGKITTKPGHTDSACLRHLLKSALELKTKVQPDLVGIEKYQFMRSRKNDGKGKKQGACCGACGQELKSGEYGGLDPTVQHSLQAVGIVQSVFHCPGLEMYQPQQMKLAVTGRKTPGKAGKKEVQEAVKHILKIEGSLSEHVADAAGHALKRLYMSPIYLRAIEARNQLPFEELMP